MLSQWLDLMILKVFSNLNDSVIKDRPSAESQLLYSQESNGPLVPSGTDRATTGSNIPIQFSFKQD